MMKTTPIGRYLGLMRLALDHMERRNYGHVMYYATLAHDLARKQGWDDRAYEADKIRTTTLLKEAQG